MERPNILFLMSDEHRADVAGFAGNDVVRTPVLDELARTGVGFHNAYTPSPICVPGRQCLMSGQLPRTCGCEGRHADEFARYERPFAEYKWSDAREIQRAGVGDSHVLTGDAAWTEAARRAMELHFNHAQYDRFATLCDLTGLPTPGGLDSRSLAPLLRGEVVDWSDETVSQFGKHNLMIKRGALKYQSYGSEMPEVLFDLERDPAEGEDVIDDPADADAVAAFRTRRAELGHGPDADPGYENAGYGRT